MSINTQYMVLFTKPRDQVGPAILARQMYPNKSKKLLNKYIEATKRPYGYLFIDLKQNTPEENRLKSDIFNNIPRNENTRCFLNMVGSGMEEYINIEIPEISQFDDKPQSEQTLRKII